MMAWRRLLSSICPCLKIGCTSLSELSVKWCLFIQFPLSVRLFVHWLLHYHWWLYNFIFHIIKVIMQAFQQCYLHSLFSKLLGVHMQTRVVICMCKQNGWRTISCSEYSPVMNSVNDCKTRRLCRLLPSSKLIHGQQCRNMVTMLPCKLSFANFVPCLVRYLFTWQSNQSYNGSDYMFFIFKFS